MHQGFAVVELPEALDVRGIDDDGSLSLHDRDGFGDNAVDAFAETEIFASHADARSLKSIHVEKLRVISVGLALALCGSGVFRIDSSKRAQHDGGIPQRSAHRSRTILTMRNRNDPGAAHQSA